MLNEKQLEDYICDNQSEFVETLKKTFDIDNIKFIGRQVRIGNDNIADLMYSYKICEKDGDKILGEFLNFIIVELKFRQAEPKDLSQICRYISTLRAKLKEIDEKCQNGISSGIINGVILSFGASHEMGNIIIQMDETGNNDIAFIKLKNKLEYQMESYSKRDKYIQKLKLDDRINKEILQYAK